jgi:AbrB family looped-hinge helix DNA binding protein
MRVTSKGQVTIPIHIRERLGIGQGSEVELELVGDEARIRVVGGAHRDGRRVVERLRGRATAGSSTGDVMALTRGKL